MKQPFKRQLKQAKSHKGYYVTSLAIDKAGSIAMVNEPITFWQFYKTKIGNLLAKWF